MSSTPLSRDTLAVNQTIARYEGQEEQECFHMTAMCPDQCGHGGTTCKFTILDYIHYQKKGEYGDEKCTEFFVKMGDPPQETGVTGVVKDVLGGLGLGDVVELSWNHDYVHYEFCDVPERPITKLVKLGEEDAAKYK